jgi:penicillin-binding protein-related factor A (putative recombinase)
MWEYSFTTNDLLVRPMIIFNNASGSQTADLQLVNRGIYNFNGLKEIKTEDSTPIENIHEEQLEPEYYTLQGIKVSVDRLTPGIYIRRQGTKATKILVK